MCAFFLCLYCPVYVATLLRVDPLSKKSYQLFIQFTESDLILNGQQTGGVDLSKKEQQDKAVMFHQLTAHTVTTLCTEKYDTMKVQMYTSIHCSPWHMTEVCSQLHASLQCSFREKAPGTQWLQLLL
jgi:hypothetical protein